MMFLYRFRICNLNFQIESLRELNFPDCFSPFFADRETAWVPDIRISVVFGTYPVCPGAKWVGNVFSGNGETVQRYFWRDGLYVYRIEPEDNTEPYRLVIPTEYEDAFCKSANWLLYLAMERMLLRQWRIVLHASAVIYRSQAFVFTAPSGGGKSTQAQIWADSLGAVILNGDKVVLAPGENKCTAYGSPIAGSSGIYRNAGAPVAAVIRIAKSNVNRISRLDARSGYTLLYSELVKSTWDSSFNTSLLNLVEKVIKTTPMLALECLPDRSAAECVLSCMGQAESETK
ncbi:MAG: hypothetical protein ACI3XI_07290 [Eubacteriales bacterium]